MENKNELTSANSQRMILEAIKKIALGRSIERITMAPTGSGGIGTAQMIHGYVAKIHNEPDDKEFEEYGGTIDVGEFPDETASTEAIVHKGVLLSGVQNNSGGFLIIPTLYSDVTIISDAATKYMYVLNFSHADIIQINSHNEVSIGVSETEELDPDDNDSPDYDELEKTGNETLTTYKAESIETYAKNKEGKEARLLIEPEQVVQSIEDSKTKMTAKVISNAVGGISVTISDKKITIGDTDATEPLVLGNELAQLMMDFLTECSKIMTPTLMGTMPAINAAAFASLTSKIQKFLSKTAYTK